MSLEQASFIAQITSALAIVASLILVIRQLRQTTEAVRTASSQAHAASYVTLVTSLSEHADFAEIWRKALADPSSADDVEWVRFVAHASGAFRYFESSRAQWQQGQLADDHWHMIDQQVRSFASQPGIQAWWKLRGHWHSKAFRDWFEGLRVDGAERLYERAPVLKGPDAERKEPQKTS